VQRLNALVGGAAIGNAAAALGVSVGAGGAVGGGQPVSMNVQLQGGKTGVTAGSGGGGGGRGYGY